MANHQQGLIHTAIHASYAHSCASCGGVLNARTAKTPDKLAAKLELEAQRVAKDIFEGKYPGLFDKSMTKLVAKYLASAIMGGLGSKATKMPELLQSLTTDVYHFSAAKNYQQLKAMTLAVRDKDGAPVSFGEYKKAVNVINDQYNNVWLRTEYDATIGGSIMAGKWHEFSDNEMLEYMTVGDERVRTSHRLLDGVVKPKHNSFWDTHYPPNGWRCRCDVGSAHGNANETPDNKINYPTDIPPMWLTNTAKQGIVFPKGHAYYKHVPDEVLKEAEGLIEGNVYEIIKAKENELRFNKFETLVAYDNEGNVILEKGGDSSSVAFTTAEAKLFKNSILTHNHPSGNNYSTGIRRIGNSFSIQDIATAVICDAAEMRAVTPIVTFVMKRPESGWPKYEDIKKAYTYSNTSVMKSGQKLMSKGIWSLDRCRVTHWHKVWVKVSKKLKLNYFKEG